MRALTVKQPWASAIAMGAKPLENRPKHMGIPADGEWIAIHAGLGWHEMADRVYQLAPDLPARADLPFGRIVALAYLLPGVPLEQVAASPWALGPLCIPVVQVAPLLDPVPATGALGLWKVPPEVQVQIRLADMDQWKRPTL
jgi:hypothetical protein